jgi:LuxR family maltose regulon positive regulatory protein
MSSIPISKTKIIPPRRRAELLTRRRLLDMLFEFLDKRLILLSAPAGYGKTSLLIDLVHHSELPCSWLALDELDRDPQRFIAYFIAALSERFPAFGGQSISVLNEMNSFDQDMERLLVTLVNEMYEHIHEHFILVLDDFHLVEGIQPIQYFLNRFIQLVDENCHVILSSRVLNTLPDLTLMVAREQVGGLSFSDLAFRVDEFQALLAQNSKLHISDEEAGRLIEEAEGWITGLQFSGSEIMQDRPVGSSHGVGVGLFDYLGQQVLERQPADIRTFLLRTSLLEEFDAALCDAVLTPLYEGHENWQNLINAVVQNNLFVLPVGKDGLWVRYHHLFRDFLQARYTQEYPEEIAPLLARLGQAYEKLGEWEKAHYIYQQLNDKSILAEMIERASIYMIQRAHLTLETWLQDLPPSMLRTRPGLLSLRGILVYTKGDLGTGLDLLNQAEQQFRIQGDVPGLTLALVRRASAYRLLGVYPASMRDADEVIELTESNDDLQLIFAEALRVKGLALYRLGNVRQSVGFLERSLNIGMRLNDVAHIPMLLMEVGMTYHDLGKYDDEMTAYDQALQIWKQEGNLSWQANLLNNMGVMYHGQGDYEKAALALEEGLICAQRGSNVRTEVLISISLGDLYTEIEGFDLARQNYEHAAEIIWGMEDRFLIHALALSQSALALSMKDAALVRKLIEPVESSIRIGNSRYENGLINLIHGRLFLLQDDPVNAVMKLEEAEHFILEGGRELDGLMVRVWLAAAYYKNGDRAASVDKFKSILVTNGKTPHSIVIAILQARRWMEGLQKDSELNRVMNELFSQAARLGETLPAVRRQLRRQAHIMQASAPHLIIQALGPAVVSVSGQPLSMSDWQTQSVRELFFYLLTSSKPLTKEQISAVLWPEVDSLARLRLRFKNEIYRLRRAVGLDVILFDGAYYSFNPSQDYEYDVEAFGSFLEKAETAQNSEEKINLYQKAVDLIQGDYLEDIYADWAFSEREHLRQKVLHAFSALADLLYKESKLESALSVCRRALDYEPAMENIYRLSMQIHHRIHDPGSIARVYQACQHALQKVGFSPSRETEELYRSLNS